LAQERIIQLSLADVVADDDQLPIDHPLFGTRRSSPTRVVERGLAGMLLFDPGFYSAVSVVGTYNGEAGLVPISDATGGLIAVLNAQLSESVAGLSADAQAFANAAQGYADTALARANALPGVVLDDGSFSARHWQDAAQKAAAGSPVLTIRRRIDGDFVANAAGERVYVLRGEDLFCWLVFQNTTAGFCDLPPQLFTGSSALGLEGAAWVHCVRKNAAVTIRAQPAAGGGGGTTTGPVNPVTPIKHQSYSDKVTTLPVDGIEPAKVLNLAAIPAGNDRRVVVAAAFLYSVVNAGRSVSCTGTFGPTAGTKAPLTFTKLVAETSTQNFAGVSSNPLCEVVFEATLPDTTDVRDLAVTLDPGGAAHTDTTWVWAAEVQVVKDVGSRPAAGTDGSSGGTLADLPLSWNQPAGGLALVGGFAQNGTAGPVTFVGGGVTADDVGKTASNTTFKDMVFGHGHVATTGAAQSTSVHLTLAVDWAKYQVAYLPKAGVVVPVGQSPVTVGQPAGVLSAVGKHCDIFALSSGVDYEVDG
jgi:hypothetical protein